MIIHLVRNDSGYTACNLPRESGRRITAIEADVTCEKCIGDPLADAMRAGIIASALADGKELKEMRGAYGAKSRERAVKVRVLSQVYGMTQREIAIELGMSNPRVWEIIHGPRPRKKRRDGQDPGLG